MSLPLGSGLPVGSMVTGLMGFTFDTCSTGSVAEDTGCGEEPLAEEPLAEEPLADGSGCMSVCAPFNGAAAFLLSAATSLMCIFSNWML